MKWSDDMIKKALGITPHDADDESNNHDCNTIILEEYLTRFTPAETFGPGIFILTTADIISELSDMADLSPDDVNAVMTRLGYRPGRNNSGSFGWMIRNCAD